jgi:hypothetical protein
VELLEGTRQLGHAPRLCSTFALHALAHSHLLSTASKQRILNYALIRDPRREMYLNLSAVTRTSRGTA